MELNKENVRLGTILVVSGPSGSGKSTLCKGLRQRVNNLCFSVSCTTRQPRPGEVHGEDYYFINHDEFERRIANNEFIEYAKVFDNYYGTLYSEVADRVKNGHVVFLDIDVQGAMQIKKRADKDELLRRCAEFIFIAPPNYAELERRLRGRGTEQEEVIQKRLAESSKEMDFWKEYDYLILNDDWDRAGEELYALYQSFKVSTKRINNIDFYYE